MAGYTDGSYDSRRRIVFADIGRTARPSFDGQGCVISQASASMLSEEMFGKNVGDVKAFTADDMLKLYGPRLTPNRPSAKRTGTSKR